MPTFTLNIHCVPDDSALKELLSSVTVDLGVEFFNTSSFTDPTANVEYALRPISNKFSIVNWEEYVNTYEQEPSSTPASFLAAYSPMRLFLDKMIMSLRSRELNPPAYSYQQFPNHKYSVDVRLSVFLLPFLLA